MATRKKEKSMFMTRKIKWFLGALVVLFILSILVGCAGSPARIAMMDKKELSNVSDKNLVNAIHFSGNDRLMEEAKNRGLFTSREIRLIKEEKIAMGMSEKALLASWGRPSDINKSVGSFGVHKQYVYRGGSYSDSTYVYLEDGEVTSWQN